MSGWSLFKQKVWTIFFFFIYRQNILKTKRKAIFKLFETLLNKKCEYIKISRKESKILFEKRVLSGNFLLLRKIIVLTGVNISCVVVGWNCCSMDFPYAFTACLNCKLFTKANTVNTYRQPPYAVVHVDRFKSIRLRINCIHVNECFIETVGDCRYKVNNFNRFSNICFNMYTQHYHSILVLM